jgi:hypothetical protein
MVTVSYNDSDSDRVNFYLKHVGLYESISKRIVVDSRSIITGDVLSWSFDCTEEELTLLYSAIDNSHDTLCVVDC